MIVYDQVNNEVAQSLIREYEKDKADRSTWTDHWDNVAEFGVPRKDNVYGQRTRGEKTNNLFTGFAIWCIDFVGAAFHGMLTNPSSMWYGLTTGIRELDSLDTVRIWLDEVAHRMNAVLNSSNFQTEIHETYIDIASFGTNILMMSEDDEEVIKFQSIPIYNATIRENDKGDVVEVGREFEFDAVQLNERYKDLRPEIKDNLNADRNKKYCIIHILKPRKYAEMQGQLRHLDKNLPKSQKFVSFHILKEAGYILETGGFEENPYAVPRWSKTSDEKYGRSPLMKALSDVKLVNAMKKVTIQGAQLTIAPPVVAPDNGFLRPLTMKPFSVNYKRSTTKEKVEPVFTGANPSIGLDIIQSIQEEIKSHFYVDQLKMIVADRMTATEVIQRRDEQLRSLGPLLGRLHRELLKPIIDRTFNIMLNKGLLPEIPEELAAGGELKIKYLSSIAKAQITSEADNVVRAIQATSPLFELKPEIADYIDADYLLKYNFEVYGAPPKCIKPDAEVEKVREARAQAQQEMIQQEQEMQQTEQMSKLAPLAKE